MCGKDASRVKHPEKVSIVQYNTIQLIFDITLLHPYACHDKLRSVLSRLDSADAMALQSIVGEELAQGPYVTARACGLWAVRHRTYNHAPTRCQTEAFGSPDHTKEFVPPDSCIFACLL